jgi:hypothetical protein
MAAPLSNHALDALRRAVKAPVPRSEINPGVVSLLRRLGLATVKDLQSPFPSHHGRKIPHVLATLAGAERVRPVPPDRKIPPPVRPPANPVRTPGDGRRIERRGHEAQHQGGR